MREGNLERDHELERLARRQPAACSASDATHGT